MVGWGGRGLDLGIAPPTMVLGQQLLTAIGAGHEHVADPAIDVALSAAAIPPMGLARRAAASFLDLTGTQTVSCTATGNDLRFRGGLARVVCPAKCQANPEAVAYGSGAHPMRSSVCVSAMVDKVIPYTGGEILVTKVPALPGYSAKEEPIAASLAVTNEEGDAFHTYAIDTLNVDPALPPVRRLKCEATFNSLNMPSTTLGTGSSLVVQCPGRCAPTKPLHGTTLFTPESQVCRAAEHAGVIGSDGGNVMVTLRHGVDRFYGSKVGKMESADAGPRDHAYTVALPTSDVLSRTKAAFL